jgi:hypothetical protein
MRLARALLKGLLFVGYLLFAISLLLFALFEVFPGLLDVVNLDSIRYYAQKRGNETDDRLVFRPRLGEFTIDTAFNGDLYDIDPQLRNHVPPAPIRYTASYRDGFRVNSSSPPYDMLIIGDSFVDIGESDSSTFSELVARRGGFATVNLGRGGYGPYQYKELLSEYAKLRPRYAVVCFFAGNDVVDVKHYEEFLAGGDYGIYVRGKNFVERYAIATSETFSFVRTTVVQGARKLASAARSRATGGGVADAAPRKIRDYIGAIRLRDGIVPMRFSYWNPQRSAGALLEEKEWQSLKRVLRETKTVADQNRVELIILYIPTKVQVYGRHIVERESGAGFLARIPAQLKYEGNTLEAFTAIANELGLEVVDLDAHFKKLAAEGELLFYPFDTHWNARGRELAAEYLVTRIRPAQTPARGDAATPRTTSYAPGSDQPASARFGPPSSIPERAR